MKMALEEPRRLPGIRTLINLVELKMKCLIDLFLSKFCCLEVKIFQFFQAVDWCFIVLMPQRCEVK